MSALNPTRAELLRTFALDTRLVRGSGCHLFDDQGRQYLDFLSQYGALPFGHNHPRLWSGLMAAQHDELPSLVQPLHAVEAERLAQRLADIAPGDLGITTLTNSGAETVEAAIKLARVRTGRTEILSTSNSFHGKTLGALSATGKPLYQKGFAAPAPGFGYLPYGDLDALRARLEAGADRLAAFIVEPIQGEGGVVRPPEGYIDGAIALCRSHGVLTILDEIQTGLGRTGALFACSRGREVPDMLLLSKALGGGMMAIGACIVRPSVWDDRFGRLHSSTFANNNLACRAANVTLDLLLEDDGALVESVAWNGVHLENRLTDLQRAYPEVIREVRGQGYMMGVEFHRFDDRIDSATMAFSSLNGGVTPLISSYLMNIEGVITAPLFNDSHVLRLQPPLISGRAEIDRAVDALGAVCDIVAGRDYYRMVRHLVATPPQLPDAAPADAGPAAAAVDAATPVPGKFAFLIHYTEEEDIFRSDPSFRQFDEAELGNWCDWVKQLGPGYVRRIPPVTSLTGQTAEGWILSVPMLPRDMRGRERAVAAAMIRDAVDMAQDAGVSRLGLGAFTSIATRGGEMATGRGVPITSGNTLTTVSAVRAIGRMAERSGMDMANAHVAVVGASGAIGRLGALMLSRLCGRMTLVGNAKNPFSPKLLAHVADEICATLSVADTDRANGAMAGTIRGGASRFGLAGTDVKGLAERFDTAFRTTGRQAPLDWTTDIDAAMAHADIVLVATSSETAVIDTDRLKPGTLVCDVARPQNVAKADISDRGILVFDGGLVSPPFAVDLGAFQTLPQDLCWGCLGETMLLALARQDGDYSIGSRLSLKDADLIAELAERHGFEPAVAQWHGHVWTDGELDRFARAVAATRRGAEDRTFGGQQAPRAQI